MEPVSWVKELKRHAEGLSIYVDAGETRIPEVIRIAEENGVKIRSITLKEPSLEDVYLNFTGRSIREEDKPITRPPRGFRRWL